MTNLVPLQLSLLVVLFVLALLTSYGQWHFRKDRSLILRCAPAMLHCAWLSFVVCLIDYLRLVFYTEAYRDHFCWAFKVRFVFEHQNVFTMLFAAYRVVFFMELAAHLARTRDSQNRANLLAGRGGWYVKYRHWIEWKRSQYFFLVQGLSVLAIVLIMAIFDDGCGQFSSYRMLGPVLNGIYLICIIYIIYRLSRCGRDAFGIKMDLARMSFVCIILKAAAYGLFAQNGENWQQATTEALILWANSLWVLFCLALYPVVRVMRSRDTFTEPTSLEDLVKRPSGYESFLEFLNSEFASESLHFWNTVNLYRTRCPALTETKARVDYADEVTETFIRPSAVLEVNLTSTTKTKIYELLSACKKECDQGREHPELLTIFDVAQAEIMKVMSRDNFRRYLKSPQYENWKEHISTRRGESSSNSNSNHSAALEESSSKRGALRNALGVVVTKVDAGSSHGGNNSGFERLPHTPRSSQAPADNSSHSAAPAREPQEDPSSIQLATLDYVKLDIPSESENEPEQKTNEP